METVEVEVRLRGEGMVCVKGCQPIAFRVKKDGHRKRLFVSLPAGSEVKRPNKPLTRGESVG